MDDEVVQEIDVYIVKELSEHLYVLQYPLRTADNPYVPSDDTVSVDFQWRPIQQQAKMTVEKETDDGDRKTVQLISSQMPMKSTYAVCSFEEMDGKAECYITPLVPRDAGSPSQPSGAAARLRSEEAAQMPGGGVLQLLPDFSHLNAPDIEAGAKVNEGDGSGQLVDTRTKNQKQHVSWELTQSKFVRTYVRVNDFDEAYVPLRYCHANTDRACDLKDRLVPDSVDVKPARTVPVETYVSSISRDISQVTPPGCVYGACTVFSQRDLALLPLDQQVLHLFHGAEILRFATVKELVRLEKPVTDHELVNAIDKTAVLMHGVWVIRTRPWHAMSQGSQTHFKELTLRAWINPADKRQFRNPPNSPVTALAEKRKHCRDQLLVCLHERGEVRASDIEEIVVADVSLASLQAMLEPLCVLTKDDAGAPLWQLRMDDPQFMEAFPDHAARSNKEWQMERLRLQATMKHEDNEKLRVKEHHEASADVVMGGTEGAVDAMEIDCAPLAAFPMTDLHRAMQAVFQKHFILNQPTLTRLLNSSESAETLDSVRNDLTNELHGVYVLKGAHLPGASLVDQRHWDAVVGEFRKSRDKGRSALNRAVSKALMRDYNSRVVSEMLVKLARKKDRITWTLKDGTMEEA
mmetsp:Transcript_63/g.218  ORF Transcript_63/g.218 Transcript_63/m.218 type:complete len:634 (-) Transcript_63:868-2769(-)